MNLTEISVSYGGTQSLPEYSNTKVAITLTATLDEGDDPTEAEALLWQHAKDAVHAQIDAALELNGKPAKYSTEPRYQVLRTYWNQWDHRGETKPPQYVIITPDSLKLDRYAYAQRLIGDSSKLRYGHAQKVAAELLGDTSENYTLLDCSNGDLTALESALASVPPAAQQEPDLGGPGGADIYAAAFEEDEGYHEIDDDDE